MKEKILQVAKEEFGLTTLAIEFFVDKLEPLINQDVEKRIAERMLSDEDIIDYALFYVSHKSLKPTNKGLIKDAIIIGMKELRSRLTCSEKPNNSQKTEGGEG